MLYSDSLALLEEKIGYVFQDKLLLRQAVTHSSFSNEQKIGKFKNYERLEFLGDAVLELISSDFLFHKYEDVPEGKLTKLRASMVCEPALAFCARDLEIGKFMLLGKGEEMTGGRNRESITADVMEAITGAIFLDGGIEEAKRFIYRFILSDTEKKQLFYDSKTILQEMVQQQFHTSLEYHLLEESGPDHDKQFTVAVLVAGKTLGHGQGRTKKAAEQQAAYEALLILKERK